MFMLQAAQAPIVLTHPDGRKIRLPKLEMDDLMIWASEIDEQRREEVLGGLNPAQQREYMTMYGWVPPDINEMRRRVRTLEGIQRLTTDALTKADVRNPDGSSAPALTEKEVGDIKKMLGSFKLAQLAILIADLDDTSAWNPNGTSQDGDDADPSKRAGRGGSKTMRGTGTTTSHTSSSPTERAAGGSSAGPSSTPGSQPPASSTSD